MRRGVRFAALALVALVVQACNSTEATLDPNAAAASPSATAAAPQPAAPATASVAADPLPSSDVASTNPLIPGGGSTSTPAPASENTIGNQAPGMGSLTRIFLAPVVGTPVEAARPLSQRLAAQGKERNLDFRGEGAVGVRYVLKGYFSALPEDRQTLIVYVWDVLDPAGTRLHRIQGQEKAPAGGGKPWSKVPAATMESIADRTIVEFATWLGARPG